MKSTMIVVLELTRYLVLIYGVCGNSITFSEEPTIHDVHFMDGRLSTYPRCGSMGRCATECYSEPSCVSFGYASTTTSCQLYDFDVANFTVNVIQQSNTAYYKAVCDRPDYTYVRSLNICMKIYHVPSTFEQAQNVCKEDGASLMKLDSTRKKDYLTRVLAHIYSSSIMYFLGGIKSAGKYVWENSDGFTTPITLGNGEEFWGTNQPKSNQGDCIVIDFQSGGKTHMQTSYCNNMNPFICTKD